MGNENQAFAEQIAEQRKTWFLFLAPYQITSMSSVLNYSRLLVEALENDYVREYPNSGRVKQFNISSGRKYYKINEVDGGVHAFVDKESGDLYKAASYKAPADGVRYNLLDESSRELALSKADWAGGYLYKG
jgi:hypothetical protein